MTIVRSPRVQRDFTIISNSVCLDERLSMRALGLLVRLLSRPDNWQTSSDSLAREFSCGRDQMRGVLQELQEAGYMRLERSQNELGQWASKWIVFDEPSTNAEAWEPRPGIPYFGVSGRITRTDLTRTDNKEEAPALPEGFEEFWKTWPPSKRKGSKSECLKVWNKHKLDKHRQEILSHLQDQKSSEGWLKQAGEFIPSPLTYLRQKRWDGAEAASQNQFAGMI